MVVIEMENGGKIEIELSPEAAPVTVKNFEKLVSEGFYDGLIFHRVIKGFLPGSTARQYLPYHGWSAESSFRIPGFPTGENPAVPVC